MVKTLVKPVRFIHIISTYRFDTHFLILVKNFSQTTKKTSLELQRGEKKFNKILFETKMLPFFILLQKREIFRQRGGKNYFS